jgi:hypothetical protein
MYGKEERKKDRDVLESEKDVLGTENNIYL